MSKITMPKTNNKIFLNKKIYIEELKKIVKKENILSHEDELKPYETDGTIAILLWLLQLISSENDFCNNSTSSKKCLGNKL